MSNLSDYITFLGRAAYDAGIPPSDNPCVEEGRRVCWQTGWIKAYNLDNHSDKYEEGKE